MATKITVVIQTYNEEKNIAECIESAKYLSNDILVVDMESTDQTKALSKAAGVHIKTFPFSRFVEPARKFAIEQAKGDWVFLLDADERITHALAKEIHATLDETDYTYFKIPRKNVFGRKKWLKHGGWWPDKQMRLIKKTAFKDWPERIHATPVIEGDMGTLQHPFTHYFHGDLEGMVNKTIIYEDIEASLLNEAGRTANVSTFFRKFYGELYRRMFAGRGFSDGGIGIIESLYQAFSKTITYLFLYEKKNGRSV